MAQPDKGISKNTAKPLPNLPHSKLHLQFFSLHPWQPWQPESCTAAEKLALATTATPAGAKE